MNILPKEKEKRIQFAFAVFGTLVVLGLVWMFLIQPQNNSLRDIAGKQRDEMAKLQKVKEAIKKADEISAQLADVTGQLSHAEQDMASGDVYAWTYDTIRGFKASYHVDIPSISQPTMGEVNLVPQFPYKQIKVSISGTAFYHDLGKFIADFENTFPHIRLINLSIEPTNGQGADSEKLSFQMEIIALVKPNS
jgi:Tfp pilus assembly protein PilO